MHAPVDRVNARLAVVLCMLLPWVQPWAPGPLPNTVPLLVSWGALGLLLSLGRWPAAHELARAWAWAALLSSVIGLAQYFGQAAWLAGWVHVPASPGEAMGNLRQRNQLATLIAMGAVAVLWWHRQGLGRRHALWMMALLAAGSAATGSRTGLLQWLLLPALALLWQGRAQGRAPWSWTLLVWGLCAYLLALALPQALALTTGTQIGNAMTRMVEDNGCGSRLLLWANVLQLIGQQPWSGWGWNELKFAHYMADYPGARFCDILGNAHNLPLQLGFALGVPAALGLTGGALVLALRARPWQLAQSTDSLAWGVLAMIALHSLLEFPLWYGPFQLACVAAVPMLWRAAGRWLQQQRPVAQALGAGLLTMALLIGADYARVRQIYLPHEQRWSLWQGDPWGAARQTLFFGDALRFAELTSTPVTRENARAMLQASQAMLHYSPEPRVIDKLIESARLSDRPDLADWHQARKVRVYGEAAR